MIDGGTKGDQAMKLRVICFSLPQTTNVIKRHDGPEKWKAEGAQGASAIECCLLTLLDCRDGDAPNYSIPSVT